MSDSQSNIAELVIDAFGGLTATSRALNGTPISTVDSWKRSGRIPEWRDQQILAAAKRRKVTLPAEYRRLARKRAA